MTYNHDSETVIKIAFKGICKMNVCDVWQIIISDIFSRFSTKIAQSSSTPSNTVDT